MTKLRYLVTLDKVVGKLKSIKKIDEKFCIRV